MRLCVSALAVSLSLSVAIPAARAQQEPGYVPEPAADPQYEQVAQPPTAPPQVLPPPPPAQPPQTAYAPAAPAAPAPVPEGEWVFTQQYGWVWMPYAGDYVSVPQVAGALPQAYVYAPAYGWSWVAAPWVFHWGVRPYWGARGPVRFVWARPGYYRAPLWRPRAAVFVGPRVVHPVAGPHWGGGWRGGWHGGGWHGGHRGR